MSYFKNLFESVTDYRKIVLLMFLSQNDKNLIKEIKFSKNDNIRLILECKKIFLEQHEEYLDFVKNEDESVIEDFLNN